MVADRIALAIKELRGELATRPNRGRRSSDDKKSPQEKVWKQWKHWCYRCGTNVTHASRGHDNHLDATKDKPQGGNSTKDKFRMKWCAPVTYQAKDTPG